VSDTVLAIDLGGTRFRAGVASTDDPVAVRQVGEWPAPRDREGFLALVSEQLQKAGGNHLGLGVPGLARGTTCVWIPNLPYLDGLDLATVLPGMRMALGNDAQFALVAETAAGAAEGREDAVLLAIGTGIGSAVLAAGQIVPGSGGGACSFGWAAADVDDAGDDVSGWLERHASGRALDAVAAPLGVADGTALVEAARSGDAKALEALELPMRTLGTALAGAVALLDPSVVILAGGVVKSLDVLEPMILAPLRRQLPKHLRGIEIKAGQFGARAGLVGAAVAGSRGPGWRRQNG
jgi:glucokinase